MKLEELNNEYVESDGTKIKIIPIGNGSGELKWKLNERLGEKKAYYLKVGKWVANYTGVCRWMLYGLPEKDLALFNAYNHLEDGMEMVGYGDCEQEEGYDYYGLHVGRFIEVESLVLDPRFIYARRKKAEEKPELVVEEGKRYITRSGYVTEKIKASARPLIPPSWEPPFKVVCNGVFFSYTLNGKVLGGASSRMDLIKEYTTPADTININGYDVPQPVREPLKNGDMYYRANPFVSKRFHKFEWVGNDWDLKALRYGLIHLSKKAVKKHNKALKSFTKLNK